ncbi:hypothetical protein Q8W71_22995 [Methylobacterium sp. NEAU 140]|uniref:hypothetical protein n=1 Tax=Methylobacterium sp. NEAU 140 TaxID=3064945 RepID=UPI00273747E2|nr:hypothetical protein [Methylobacterium sp. NEAU 140]MDP4025505.1 hypothetical protein [Methylobacterium sp. NEAU 140]
MRTTSLLIAAALCAACGPALAQGQAPTSRNSAAPGQEADKMRAGDKAGSLPNSANPGSDAGADGNRTQDTRTTKDPRNAGGGNR